MSESNDYIEAFLTKKPKEGIAIVQERLKDSMTLDKELADYFKARAEIEENYAKSLSKASKRLYIMDPGVLGHFAPVWETLLKELNQVANYHSELAHKVLQEIEIPLRTPASEDHQRLEQMEPIIHSIENKNRLSSVKGSLFKKSNKSASWENQGVEYLSLAQKMDEARLKRIKRSVTQFEQIQSEQLMKRVEYATKTLSKAETFDVQHDIRDFCTERGKGLSLVRPQQHKQDSHDSQRSTTSNKFKSVFMKKKKQSSLDQDYVQHDQTSVRSETSEPLDTTIPVTARSSPVNLSPPNTQQQQNAPLVDSEGFSIPTTTGQFPTIASDISSRSDDVDSDLQSLKLNQKLQINIKDDIVPIETTEANETFNKLATMLRERTPTITRKPRGRRESSIGRSQTESSLNSIYNDINMANSIGSISSLKSSTSNPFLQSQAIDHSPALSSTNVFSSSPQQLHTPTYLTDPNGANWQLQPILEDQQPDLHFSIYEKTTMVDESHQLIVDGQVFITYTGVTQTPIKLHPFHIEGIQQLSPNAEYITTTEENYTLKTTQFPQSQPVLCFTYKVHLNGDGRIALPIRLQPLWKCEQDTTLLMIKHNKHPMVQDVQGSIHVFYDHVSTVQSTPQGIWETDKKRLTWKIKDLLDQYEQKDKPRLLAKFLLDPGQVGTAQPIYLDYIVKDALVTGFTIDVVNNQSVKQTLETTVQSERIVLI